MSEQTEQSEQNIQAILPGAKVKDPRRVAAGKRLGAISRQRKEEKRLEREAQAQAQQDGSDTNQVDNEYTLYLVGGLVVVGVASCLYLNKEKVTEMLTSDKKKLSTIPEKPPSSPPKRKSRRVFGD